MGIVPGSWVQNGLESGKVVRLGDWETSSETAAGICSTERWVSGDTNRNVKSSIKSVFRGQNDTFVMENAVQRREKDDLYKWPWAPHHNITPNNHVSNTDS